jgi:hypothetical protein
LANFVPKPDDDHGKAEMNGEVSECVTAMASPVGEKATSLPVLGGSVAGLANFVPKPDDDHGKAEMNGVVLCATAM